MSASEAVRKGLGEFFRPSIPAVATAVGSGLFGAMESLHKSKDESIAKMHEEAIEGLKGKESGDGMSLMDKFELFDHEMALRFQKARQEHPHVSAALNAMANAAVGWSAAKGIQHAVSDPYKPVVPGSVKTSEIDFEAKLSESIYILAEHARATGRDLISDLPMQEIEDVLTRPHIKQANAAAVLGQTPMTTPPPLPPVEATPDPIGMQGAPAEPSLFDKALSFGTKAAPYAIGGGLGWFAGRKMRDFTQQADNLHYIAKAITGLDGDDAVKALQAIEKEQPELWQGYKMLAKKNPYDVAGLTPNAMTGQAKGLYDASVNAEAALQEAAKQASAPFVIPSIK